MTEAAASLLPGLSLTDVEFSVLSHIRRHPGRNRAAIAAELGLSKSMLTKAVGKFAGSGLIIEERVTLEDGGRGQPPIRLSLNHQSFHSIGFYLRAGSYAAVRTDLAGRVQQTLSGDLRAGDSLIPQVVQAIGTLVAQSPAPLLGIGQAVPAIVGEDGSLFEITPSQANLPLHDLAAALRSRFGLPLYWENGAWCIAAYEAQKPATSRRCLFYLTLDYGIGGGLVSDGKMFRGGYNQAANIGALVPETGPRPSLPDLARHLNLPLEQIDEARLAQMFAAQHPEFLSWIADRGQKLSLPLSAVVQLFNPDTIILGGFFPRPVLERFCQQIDLGALDTPGRRPLVRPGLEVTSLLGPAGLAEAAALLPIAAQLLGQRRG